MKFNCGKTRAQKRAEKIERLQNWHKWFAWYPVRVGDNDCRWLEYVSRKGALCEVRYKAYCQEFYRMVWFWRYRAIRSNKEQP